MRINTRKQVASKVKDMKYTTASGQPMYVQRFA